MKKINRIIQKTIDFVKKHFKQTIFAYRIILDILFILALSVIFEYTGFTLHFSLIKFVISYGALYFSIPYIQRVIEKETFSNMIVFLIYILYFIPMLSLCGLMNVSYLFFLCTILYMYIFLFLNEKLKYIKLKELSLKYSGILFNILIIAIPLFLVYISYKYTGFRLFVSFSDIYKIRLESKFYSMPVIFNYFLNQLGIIIPAMIVYCLIKKKYFRLILMILSQYLLFVFGAEKSVVISLVIIIATYFLYKKNYSYLIIPLLIVGMIFIPFESRFFNSSIILSYLYRRNLFLPPFISYQYFSFFSQHSFSFFTNGIMRWIGFSQVYPDSIANVLGNYYAYAATNLNNGLFADAFANFGFVGVIIMPIVLVISFRLMDAFSHKIPRNIMFGFAVFYMMKFVNGFWSTNLLSGGFIILAFLLFIMQDKNEKSVLNDLEYFKPKEVITLNKDKIKEYFIILGIVFISCSCYFVLIKNHFYSKSSYKDIVINPQEYVDNYQESIDPLEEYDETKSLPEYKEFRYYKALHDTLKKTQQEIEDFMIYYKIPETVTKKRLDAIYEELRKYNTDLLVAKENGEYKYSCYSSRRQQIDSCDNYYDLIKNYFATIDVISREFEQDSRFSVSYEYKDGLIINYNVFLIENNNSTANKYGAFIVSTIILFTISFIYINISGSEVFNRRKLSD